MNTELGAYVHMHICMSMYITNHITAAKLRLNVLKAHFMIRIIIVKNGHIFISHTASTLAISVWAGRCDSAWGGAGRMSPTVVEGGGGRLREEDDGKMCLGEVAVCC